MGFLKRETTNMELSPQVKASMTMALALTIVKAGADMMNDVFRERPNQPTPVGWPFPSMDEFALDVLVAMDWYRSQAIQQVITDVTEELKRRIGREDL